MAAPRHARADGGGPRQIGPFFDVVVHRIGLRAIAFHLKCASGSDGDEALVAAFKQADGVRRQLGCSWDRLICHGPGDGNGNAPR